MKMNTVLILGKGYIGKYLSVYLKQHNFDVYHLSKRDVDYTNPELLEQKIRQYNSTYHGRVDWVINCSGFTGTPNVDGCEDYKEDCYKFNVLVPLYITKVCNSLFIPIIHISSGCIYNGYDKIYTEQDISDFGADCVDSSFYSKTKDCFEKLSAHMDRYLFRIRIPFNGVYEPKNYLYKITNYNNLISKQNSITCVDDLVCFIKKFIEQKHRIDYGAYNVVNEGSVDSFDLVDMLKAKGVNNKKWNFVSTQEANFRVCRSNCILSTDKIKSIGLGLPNVKESLFRAVDEFSKQWIKINKKDK
jgi:dTDP-4-dehydrorhamnose reductase